jgi:hypothetical protein
MLTANVTNYCYKISPNLDIKKEECYLVGAFLRKTCIWNITVGVAVLVRRNIKYKDVVAYRFCSCGAWNCFLGKEVSDVSKQRIFVDFSSLEATAVKTTNVVLHAVWKISET